MLLTGSQAGHDVVLALVAGLMSRAFPAAVFAPGQFTRSARAGVLLLRNLVLAFFNLIPIRRSMARVSFSGSCRTPPRNTYQLHRTLRLRHPDRRDLDDPGLFGAYLR